MRALQMKSKFGEVREISAVDWVDQVNKAGDGIWVVLHLYKQGYVLYLVFSSYEFPLLSTTLFFRLFICYCCVCSS